MLLLTEMIKMRDCRLDGLSMGSEEVVREAVEPGGGGRPVACITAACVVERSVSLDMP